jgi:hypothetical protein
MEMATKTTGHARVMVCRLCGAEITVHQYPWHRCTAAALAAKVAEREFCAECGALDVLTMTESGRLCHSCLGDFTNKTGAFAEV